MDVKKTNVRSIQEIDGQYGYPLLEEEEKNKDWLMQFLEYIKQSKERDLARLRKSVVR